MRLTAIHGGLWEDMTPDRFWHRTGAADALTATGLHLHTPARPTTPATWDDDLAALPTPTRPTAVLGASNGVTTAIRLTRRHPDLVTALILAWPATRDEPDDALTAHLRRRHAPEHTINDLTSGETLRGVTDDLITALDLPIAIIPAPPGSPHHRPETVTALAALRPDAAVLPESPEPPRPDFPGHRRAFAADVAAWLAEAVRR